MCQLIDADKRILGFDFQDRLCGSHELDPDTEGWEVLRKQWQRCFRCRNDQRKHKANSVGGGGEGGEGVGRGDEQISLLV